MPQEWYVRVGSEETGPLTLQELFVRCRTDQLEPKSQVRSSDGNGKWRDAENVDEILFGNPEELREASRNVVRSPDPDLSEDYWNTVFESIERNRSDAEEYSSSMSGGTASAISGGSIASSALQQTAVSHLGRGLAWLRRDAFDAAITEFTEAVRLDPQLGSAFHARGKARLKKDDFASAVRDFDAAIRLDPKYALPSAYDIEDILDAIMELHEDSPDSVRSLKSLWADCPLKLLEVIQERLNPVFDARGVISQQDSGEVHQMNGPDFSVLKKGYRPTTSSYELTKPLGDGGFGLVWRADNQRRGRTVAFKFCLNLEESSVASLKNELSKIKLLDHPGIVKLEEEHLDASIPFLQYEFIDGVDLGKYLNQRFVEGNECRLRPADAAAVILKLVEIMAFVHSLPIPVVHRDLKPANILVSNIPDLAALTALGIEPDVRLAKFKLMDFGLASHSRKPGRTSAAELSLGAQFDGWGTRAYMSPQQRNGDAAHPTDDIFAIGVIWYLLLMGSGTPSGGTEWHSVVKKRGMPEDQLKVLIACLELKREDRIPNAVELEDQIRDAYKGFEPKDLFLQVKDAIHRRIGFENVTSLSVEMADLLAKEGIGDLSGLVSLPDAVAECLATSPHISKLVLDGVTSLSDEAANALSRFRGDSLILSGLTSLSEEAARSLAEFKGRWLCLDGLENVEDGVAGALASSRTENKHVDLTLNGVKKLTPADAADLAKGNWRMLCLNGLKGVDSTVARALATSNARRLVLNGLNTLDSVVGSAIAKWNGEILALDGLETLGGSVSAYCLGESKATCLSLRGLKSLEPESAKALAKKNGGELWLDGLTMLKLEAALALSKWNGKRLFLNGLTTITLAVAQAIEEWEVEQLCLDGLSSLPPDVAFALSTWKVKGLRLNGLSALSLVDAQTLSKCDIEELQLDGLKTLNCEAGEVLAEWEGSHLSLNGIEVLSKEEAKALLAWDGYVLAICGLIELEEGVADAISEWRGGWLFLDGVKWVEAEDARSLARWEGDLLNLDGLSDLTSDAAHALGRWQGTYLNLNGLKSLPPEVCEGLVAFEGISLSLNGLTRLDAAPALAKWNGNELRLNGIENLPLQNAEALASWKGARLFLNGLTTLQKDAAQALARWAGEEISLIGLEPESARIWNRAKQT